MALSSVHFDAQSGYTEIALMKIQCMLEWHFLRPCIPDGLLQGSSMLGLFEKFWDKGVPKIGEVGSRGWGKWAEKEVGLGSNPENLPKRTINQDEALEEEDGWTGWVAVTKGDTVDGNDGNSDFGESISSENGSETEESELSDDLEEDEKELMTR